MTRIDISRLQAEIDELALISENPPPVVTRVLFSEADLRARAFVKALCRDAGLGVREDAVGNLFARWEGADADLSPVATGSHIDAIPNAGKYDGVVGVLGAIEAMRALKRVGFEPRRSIELIVFTAEEPTRFGIGCLGSRLLAGALSPERAAALRDSDGHSLDELRRRAGLSGELARVAITEPGSPRPVAFIELHIEQGPVLERDGIPIGIVERIAGPSSYCIRLTAEGGHAGAVLMPDRHDAGLAAAEIALAVERAAFTSGSADTVGTTGVFRQEPNAVNSVPCAATLEIDFRDTDLATRNAAWMRVEEAVAEICARRGVRFEIENINADKPAQCAPELVEAIAAVCADLGLPAKRMISRAYHDSLFMAQLCPTTMIFIPCRAGVSHRPDEYSSPEQIEKGVRVLAETLARYADEIRFTLNGREVRVEDCAPDTTLLDWLRRNHLVGTKCGCNEGDCGACTVAVLDTDGRGRPAWRAMNSCIALLPMFAGRELVTVEGLARDAELHPAQACLVRHYGSQCGYCTPGFVMSLFEGCHRTDLRERWQIADQLCGNLCRCTGYRPIRDAALEIFASKLEDGFARNTPTSLCALDWAANGGRFLRPTSLAELLALKRRFPEARLVAGATEIGVEINKKFARFPQLISVEAVGELCALHATPEAWYLGAAATLTQIEEALQREFPAIDQMLWAFASRQIRNRATLGGNLVTASPIGDGAPVLLALDASLILASAQGERTLPLAEFFTGYRKTAMRANEVLKTIVLPRVASRRAEFFKVSKRRELDISIVAAACCVETDAGGIVKHARIAYGGVAATPGRALRAEEALSGKTLAAARDDVSAMLREEFSPIDDLRGSAEYRRGLIVSLWEKFVSGERSEAQDTLPDFAPDNVWDIESLSRAVPHESAIGHVTGRAQYVDDVAQSRAMLEIWPVCAPHAHAKILRRDARAALTVPGVYAVLMAEDIPGHNDVGVSRKDEILLARDEVLYHGHLVAIVVGETLAACREAARRVVIEYEPLPAILTVRDAAAAGSFHTEPNFMRRGDVRAALARSVHTFTGEFEMGGQEHFYLETHAAWAEIDAEGNVFVCSSTQHPSEIQTIVAEVLGLPRNRAVVQSPRMGGGFGGKETQGNTWAALVALAALKTGRPVRVQLDRDLDMQLTGKRHPFYARFEVGYDAEGRLTALKCDLISNGGWSLDLSMPVTDRALFHLDNAYYIPAVEASGRVAKTHLTSQTAFRGFGGPQGMLVIEEILDRIARRLGLPPHVVRERNLYHGSGETNTTHYGQEIGDNRLQTIWHQLKASADFDVRRAGIHEWNTAHPRIKRGLAITPVKFGISFTFTPYNQAGALVLIYRDGTVQVNHGGTEMGQGLHTKILGVVMRELGLPAERIRLMPTATDKIPNTSATAASSGSDLNGAAVCNACVELRTRLMPIAAEMLGTKGDIEWRDGRAWLGGKSCGFAEVVERAWGQRISLSAAGYYATPEIHWDRATGRGRPFYYFACGAAVSEVEVDGYTGMSKVLRVDILHDVGDSLNPGVDRGQIEGGFVQGLGWLTREDLRWDAEGRLLTHSASTYQIPAFSDAPVDFRVRLFPNAAQTGVIHGSKAVGEPPLMLAISVREAIREAVASFGNGARKIALASPATGEAVFAAIAALQRNGPS